MKAVRRPSLSRVVAIYVAVAMIAGMSVYAAFQYYLSPGHSVTELFLAHLSHLLVVGTLTCVVLYLALLKMVVQPIWTLQWKLLRIADGDTSPVEIDTGIREVQEIAQGINRMLEKAGRPADEISLRELSVVASELRLAAQRSEVLEMTETLNLLAIRIEKMVAKLQKVPLSGKNGRE